MTNQDDRWLWFIDDGPLQALLKAEGELGTMKVRAASSPALVRAMTAHMEGRAAEAMKELEAGIAGGERQPDIFLLLGQMQFEAQRFEDAAGTYKKLRDADAQNALAAYNHGVTLEKLGRWADAAEAFSRATKLDAERKEAWLGLGLSCLHQRRPDEALTSFTRFLNAEPGHESALFGRAVALQMLRRFDEAAAIYEQFRAQGEPTVELLTNLLALAVARKDNASLTQLASELDKVRPGSRQADEAMAYGAVLAGDWETAAARLDRLAGQETLSEDWGYARAYSLWRAGNPEAALRALDEAAKGKPNHGPSFLLRGAILEEAGQLDGAAAADPRAAGQTQDAESAWWNVARVAAADGRSDVCHQAAKALLDRNKHSAQGWYAKGLAAIIDDQLADATKAFQEACRVRPDWAEAQWNLGLTLLESGEALKAEPVLESAIAHLEGQVAIEPLARAALSNGNPAKAYGLIREEEYSPELLYNIAYTFQEQGDMEHAEECYRRVIDSTSNFADARINLGHVLLAQGRPAEAEAAWAGVQ